MKKILSIILVCIMILTVSIGCTRGEEDPQLNEDENQEIIAEEEEVSDENKETEESIEAQRITGTYVGQIDNTSIEVTVDGEPKVFRNYEMSQLLEGIEDGDQVEIHYIEENGQLMIQNLKKL